MRNSAEKQGWEENVFSFASRGCQVLPWVQVYEKYWQIYCEHATAFETLHQQVTQSVCRREYAKSDIFLGCYSPDVSDLVVSGMHRGKVYKHPSSNSRYTHEYLFDDADRLLCVYEYEYVAGEKVLYTANLLLHQSNRVLILCYSVRRDAWLEGIAECLYGGQKQIQFEHVLCVGNPCGVFYLSEVQTQWYEESEKGARLYWWQRGQLPRLDVFDFLRNEQGDLYEYSGKCFQTDQDGRLLSCREYAGRYKLRQRRRALQNIDIKTGDGSVS